MLKMINQVAAEALYSATYVENYLDCVENLPENLQRHLSRMRELDVNYRACIREVEIQYESLTTVNNDSVNKVSHNNSKKERVMQRIQQSLIAAQEFGDEKLQVVQLIQDLIDNKSRMLDMDYKNLDYSKDEPVQEPPVKEQSLPTTPVAAVPTVLIQTPLVSNTNNVAVVLASSNSGERASKRARRTRTELLVSQDLGTNENIIIAPIEQTPVKAVSVVPVTTPGAAASTGKKGNTGTGKKKKRKARTTQQSNQRDRDDTPPPEDPDPIDPDEPTYCLCDQISFGEMILCDNDLCPIEWFHFSCVSLSTKPKGKWYCPKCRGDRPNIMKPKAQFLKELERYNKEKEEKT